MYHTNVCIVNYLGRLLLSYMAENNYCVMEFNRSFLRYVVVMRIPHGCRIDLVRIQYFNLNEKSLLQIFCRSGSDEYVILKSPLEIILYIKRPRYIDFELFEITYFILNCQCREGALYVIFVLFSNVF